jgi:hypothetical protein
MLKKMFGVIAETTTVPLVEKKAMISISVMSWNESTRGQLVDRVQEYGKMNMGRQIKSVLCRIRLSRRPCLETGKAYQRST